MKNHIPTIEELLPLPKRELHAIFKVASEVASNATLPRQQRSEAVHTCLQVRRVLSLRR